MTFNFVDFAKLWIRLLLFSRLYLFLSWIYVRHMDPLIQQARIDLGLLPPSSKTEEALKLLQEIEQSETEQKALLDNLDRMIEKLHPTEEEQKLTRWLPWFGGALGCMALYDGCMAIITSEFCSRSRGGAQYCSDGLNAQIQGVAVTLVGVLLLLLSLPASRWRTAGLWIFGILLFPAVFGSLLIR